MEVKIDTQANAVYIKLRKVKIAKTQDEGKYLVDFDEKGNLIGFEILNLSKIVNYAHRN